MDGPVSTRDPSRAAIEAAAINMGVVPGDPAYPFLQSMLRIGDQAEQDRRGHEARIGELLDRAEKQASGNLFHIALRELPGAIDRLVVSRYRRMLLMWAGLTVAVGIVAGLVGYYIGHPRLMYENCVAQDGGIACSGWRVLPPGKQ